MAETVAQISWFRSFASGWCGAAIEVGTRIYSPQITYDNKLSELKIVRYIRTVCTLPNLQARAYVKLMKYFNIAG